MKNKMKKTIGILIFTAMSFLLCLGIPKGVRAEDDPADFAGATEIGNITWRDPGTHKEYNVYLNDTGYFLPANDGYSVPARGPAHISLNQAYKTRMNNVLGDRGSVYGPSVNAYYYFTLENPASVTVYGQCSTASNSKLSIEKIDNIETFGPSTEPFGVMMGSDEVKALSVNLAAGNYLITLYWGMIAPVDAGTNNSYVKVIADYSINQEANSEWYETFPNNHIHSDPPSKDACKYYTTPYKIGKTMHGTTSVGNIDRTMKYTTGCYSFTVSERTQLNFESLENIYCAYVFSPSNDHNSNDNKITSMGNTMTLEPGDYILQVVTTAKGAYSFRTSTSSVPPASVIAGVDTMAISGWSVSGETVTINNLSENSEFCIWSGDKDNAGYGKGLAKLVIKGNCYIKRLVIDCPVEITCESGAKLVVGELVVNTSGGAGGKLTYTGGAAYNTATKTFEVSCAHRTKIIVGKKDATCTAAGYTGDTHCKDCNVKLQSGSSIKALKHSYDNGVITKQPTTTAEGVKTYTCSRCGNKKTEAVEKLSGKNPPVEKVGEEYSTYQGGVFTKDTSGDVRCYDETTGSPVINDFKCDGTYTYYLQADGTAMKDRLTYHPDGIHVIYFDENGHEVFSDFAHITKTISGETVDDYCFFDINGSLYVDVVTYDKTGTVIYYANAYGLLERGRWFQFSPYAKWAGYTDPDPQFANKYGCANADMSLMTNQNTTDWEGRPCYLQGNGAASY